MLSLSFAELLDGQERLLFYRNAWFLSRCYTCYLVSLPSSVRKSMKKVNPVIRQSAPRAFPAWMNLNIFRFLVIFVLFCYFCCFALSFFVFLFFVDLVIFVVFVDFIPLLCCYYCFFVVSVFAYFLFLLF
jgi:hypothetical protein